MLTSLRLLKGVLLPMLIFCLGISAQAASLPRLYFDHYNVSRGLSSNSIRYILQDKRGFIWVATIDGLNRFDGSRFRHIDPGEGEPRSFVNTIYEAPDGLLWIGAHNGAFIYDPVTEHLRRLEAKRTDGTPINQPVIQFLTDKEGRILILVDSEGVYAYTQKSETLTPCYLSDQIKVNQVVYTPSGRIWIGTFGQGLFYSDDNFSSLSSFSHNNEPYLHNAIITDMKIKGDRLYVATERYGLHAIDVNTGAVTKIFAHDHNGQETFIRQIAFDNKGLLHIATENGLFMYDLLKGHILNHFTHNIFDAYSLSDNAIYALLCDREGGIWAGSYFGGLDYADVNCMRFDKYYPDNSPNSLHSQRIRELCADPVSGLIYVGSEDHGLHSFNPSTGHFVPVDGITSDNIHALYIDNRDLWVGTFSYGLTVKDLDSGKIRKYDTSNGLINDYVFSVKRITNGDILIGTMSGLQIYRKSTDSFHPVPEFENIFVYDILEDSKGNLWVATYDHGLYLKPAGLKEWKKFRWDPSTPEGLPSDKIYGLYEDSEQTIWVMTQDGLCTFKPETSTFCRDHLGCDRMQGLVYQAIEDESGRFWMTTNHGLYCIDRKNGMIRRFTTAGGLLSNQFNYRSSLKASDGKIYLGTIEGLTSFNPVGFSFSEPTITPLISELFVNNKLIRPGDDDSPLSTSITLNDRLNLKSHQNSVAFRIVSLNWPTIESAGKELTVTMPDTPVTAYVDSEAITKIISNMITNAIKYGKRYIDIRLETTSDNFSIVIANDGDVVAPEKREEIFTLFSQLTAVRNVPGTGIGLAYARSLAQMHSGTLTMSDATDKNEFILSVPVKSGEEITQAEEKTTSDLEKMIQKNSQSVTILVVDDNMEMLNFLEKKLMGCGFRVIKANDGRDALNVLATEYVDIVVSDIMMPEIDGMELLQRIKSDVNFSHIPVILLTAKTRLEDKLSGLDSGADAYVEKPFAIEYLVGNINMLLRNRERIRQRLERMPITKVAGKGLSKVDEEFLQKINDIIQANFHNSEFSIEDVIASMGMSRTSFYRKIKGMLDLNPNEYIKIERLKKARQLFDEGHTSVSEVCYMVGFASPGYFTKCFQKQFEISPREYISMKGKKNSSPE